MRHQYRIVELIGDQAWRDDALCGPTTAHLFFVEDNKAHRPQIDAAKKICARCPSQQACLSYALLNRVDDGLWGGLTEKERRRLLKQQRETAA